MRRTISIAALCAGCASQPGVDLVLVPDPNVNSVEQVIGAVDSIVLIVDSEDPPLYPPGAERSEGTIQIENADTDPELEVVVSISVPAGRLPRMRLLQGTMPEASLELRFLGIPVERGPPVAIGRVQGVHLSDPLERLDVPFNLRPDLLPPRVTEVLPGDGASAEGCSVSAIYLMFSRPIEAATVAPAVHVNGAPPDAVSVDPSGLTATLGVVGLYDSGSSLRYDIRVDTTLTDREGRPLDQVPFEPGAQGFSDDYVLPCTPSRDVPLVPCAVGVEGGSCPYERLACVDGACVPAGCESASCVGDTVCDPATSQCVLDCRAWSGADACENGASCHPETGLCTRG